eukprot:GHUV01026971.1.p1 GENE.GHUV01026971.1~~GHUV01026971.1.p1  ORF type:complete len:161 (-),score=41.40 GHUV01026971.1:666-1148(-)
MSCRLRSSAEQNLTARYKPTLKQKSRRCRSAGCLLCVLMNRCRLCLTAAARVLLLKCCCDLARAGLANSSASRGFGATTLDPKLSSLQEKMSSNYAELSGAFKTSLEGLARTVQDLHAIIKWVSEQQLVLQMFIVPATVASTAAPVAVTGLTDCGICMLP